MPYGRGEGLQSDVGENGGRAQREERGARLRSPMVAGLGRAVGTDAGRGGDRETKLRDFSKILFFKLIFIKKINIYEYSIVCPTWHYLKFQLKNI